MSDPPHHPSPPALSPGLPSWAPRPRPGHRAAWRGPGRPGVAGGDIPALVGHPVLSPLPCCFSTRAAPRENARNVQCGWFIDTDRTAELNLRWNCLREGLVRELTLSNKLPALWAPASPQKDKSSNASTGDGVSRSSLQTAAPSRWDAYPDGGT